MLLIKVLLTKKKACKDGLKKNQLKPTLMKMFGYLTENDLPNISVLPSGLNSNLMGFTEA